MPVPVSCPGCSAKLNAPDAAAGKRVKCPKCQNPITVPAAEAGFEVVEDEPPPAKKPAPKPVVKADVEVEDDEDEAPKKKRAKVVAEDDGDDERPRKKKPKAGDDEDDERRKQKRKAAVAEEADEDDEDDEQPKKKKKKKKGADEGSSLVRNIVGGVVLVILLGVVGFVYWDKFGKKDDEPKTAQSGDPPAVIPGPGPRPQPAPKPKQPEPKTGGGKQKLRDAEMGGPVLTGDGKLLLARHVVGRSLVLGVWDVQTGSHFASAGGDKHPVDAYGVSPDRKQFAIVSHASKALTLWSAPAGQLEKTVKLTHWKDGLQLPGFATYTPDGKAVLVSYEGALLRVDVQTGAEQVVLKDVSTVYSRYSPEANRFVDAYFSPSGRTELRVIDPAQPGAPILLPLKDDENPQHRPDISADGKTVAALVVDRADFNKPKIAIYLYDVAERKLKGKIALPAEVAGAPNVQVDAVSVAPNGSSVVFCVRVFQDGKNRSVCWASDATGENPRRLGEWSEQSTQITTFARDGKTIGVLSGRLVLYDVGTGKDVTP